MADSTTILQAIFNVAGVPTPINLRAVTDGAGNYTLESQPMQAGQPIGPTNPLSVSAVVLPPPTTFQGTMAIPGSASTILTSGNVVMAPSSAACPSTFGKLTVTNTGANPVFVNWFGGVASSANGSEELSPGASDTVNLNGSAAPPQFFSTAGTTLSFRN